MSKILFHGVEYNHADQMPAAVRAEYDKAVQMLPDRDNNGIPDLLDSDNAPETQPVYPRPAASETIPPLPLFPAKKIGADKLAAKRMRWIPLAVFGGVVFCIGLIVLFVFGIFALMKSSEGYQLGLKTALASPTAQEVLGTPIQDGILVSGSVSEETASGTADISVSLNGSAHSGTLQIYATKNGDTWRLVTLTLLVGDKTYNLLE